MSVSVEIEILLNFLLGDWKSALSLQPTESRYIVLLASATMILTFISAIYLVKCF